jgi:hypothetical protein
MLFQLIKILTKVILGFSKKLFENSFIRRSAGVLAGCRAARPARTPLELDLIRCESVGKMPTGQPAGGWRYEF